MIALAGGGGDLGGRIAKAILARGGSVTALVRPSATADERAKIASAGATLAEADPTDRQALARALEGATCVVSALSGLRPVMIDRQTALLRAAVDAGVRRFIPSDFSEEFTKTPSGLNRNLDLRREFMAEADKADLQVTSVLNGAFMDMLGAELPLIQPRIGRVLFWRSADQALDFTTNDDVASYTAAAALDTNTPRVLRIAGDSITVRELAATLTGIGSRTYLPMKAGSIGTLGLMIRIARFLAPGREETFPPWQGMQYMRDMFSGAGKLDPLDNDRYPDVRFTRAREYLTGLHGRW